MDHAEFTDEEITTLVEALDAWVRKNESGEMIGDLLMAVLDEKTPEAKTRRDAERKERQQKARIEKQLAEDTATLLKAKLIRMRQTRRFSGETAHQGSK